MMFLGLLGGALSAAADVYAQSVSPYKVEIVPSFAPVLDLLPQMDDAVTPFQSRAWLDAWSATLGREEGVDVFAATVRDPHGRPIMSLPLMRRYEGMRRCITFADSGVTDYNAPFLTAHTPSDRFEANHIWAALLGALPRADVIRLERMPLHVGTRTNPLTNLSGARAARDGGLALSMPGPYSDWLKALPRRYRMELGRCARLFDALPGARFHRIGADNATVFDTLERLQRERISELALPYRLDHAPIRDFYRTLAGDLEHGPGVLTTLSIGGEYIAALFGLRQGSEFVMLRIGSAGGAYARLSPARLLITRTMEMLNSEGVRRFDFGLGDYPYKRKLGGLPIPLSDLVAARSPLGIAEAVGFRVKAEVRSNARLGGLAARFGLTSSAETEQRP